LVTEALSIAEGPRPGGAEQSAMLPSELPESGAQMSVRSESRPGSAEDSATRPWDAAGSMSNDGRDRTAGEIA
jgi:hypothetical protein